MTTQMNFGPEWMRGGGVPKRNSQYASFKNAENKNEGFKYTKDYNLGLYKTVDLPNTVQHLEHAVIAEDQSPLSLLEKEYKSDNAVSFENFGKVNGKKKDLYSLMNNSETEEVPLWSGVDKYDAVGNFDSFGVYMKQEPENEVFPSKFLTDTPRAYQWIYRDPIGLIQGPFTGLEMQGWYEAGFFELSLHVKREDVPYFESIDALILKVKNSKIPFLAPWPIKETFNAGLGLNQGVVPPSSCGNPPFAPSRVGRTALSWENNNPPSSSWLSHQNDPMYQNTRQPATTRQQDNMFEPDLDYQQSAMNQQMEHQYLTMLRQNRQQHILLQQRMVQQQQQQQQQQGLQLLLQQQQQQQQHRLQLYMGNRNYDQQLPPIESPMTRGWSSVPGTPGIVDSTQNPWSNTFNEPFIPSPPRRSRSRSPTKTQTEHDDPLANSLSNISLNEPDQAPMTAEPAAIESAWVSQIAQNKTLREIQSEEVFQSKKIQSRSNTWSAVSSSISVSNSTRNQQTNLNAWDTPVRQKRISTPSLPSAGSVSTPRSSSRHPTIKSEPKGPSEEFLKWCKLSLRELNSGVNVDDILQMLLSFPVDNSCSEIIHDIIYTNSKSMDGRRFANDFMSRRKADLDGKLNVILPKTNLVSSEFKVVTKKGKKKQQQQQQ